MVSVLLSLIASVAAVVFLFLWISECKKRDAPLRPPSVQLFPQSANTGDVGNFLRVLEPNIRKIAAISHENTEAKSLIKALAREFQIREVPEEVSEYSDGLLQRYELGEPITDKRKVRVWENYWVMGNDLLFKGVLRAEEH